MNDLEDRRAGIDFDVAKSIRYHAYRRSFWEGADRISKVLTVVSGTAVLISIVGQNSPAAKAFAFTVAIVSALDIVFGFSNRASLHAGLYRAFSVLAQSIAEVEEPADVDLIRWSRRRLEIEMDEPGILDWLERRCSAEEAAARGLEPRAEWVLKPWQIRLSQFAMWPSVPTPQRPAH